jgi:hypothetical protein
MGTVRQHSTRPVIVNERNIPMSHFSISIQCSSAYGVRSTNTTETNDGGNGALATASAKVISAQELGIGTDLPSEPPPRATGRCVPYPFNAAPRTEYGVRIRLRPMMGAMETSNRTVHPRVKRKNQPWTPWPQPRPRSFPHKS